MAAYHLLATALKGIAGEAVANLSQAVLDHFQDHSTLLERALLGCHDRS
jgi:hypothetical protein